MIWTPRVTPAPGGTTLKKLTILSALVLVAICAVPTLGATASPDLGCDYEAHGILGTLTLYGAQGQPFQVFDSTGMPVATGFALLPIHVVPVLCPAPGALRVVVGHEELLAVDRDGEWQ
jgi:hypothetical protein